MGLCRVLIVYGALEDEITFPALIHEDQPARKYIQRRSALAGNCNIALICLMLLRKIS